MYVYVCMYMYVCMYVCMYIIYIYTLATKLSPQVDLRKQREHAMFPNLPFAPASRKVQFKTPYSFRGVVSQTSCFRVLYEYLRILLNHTSDAKVLMQTNS